MRYPIWLLPLRQLSLITIVLLTCWGGVVWVCGDILINARINTIIHVQDSLIQEHADALSYNLHRSLAFLHALPSHFAADDKIKDILSQDNKVIAPKSLSVKEKYLLFSSQDELISISKKLSEESRRFDVDVIWVINKFGDCFLSSNYNQNDNFIGTNYQDRDYFKLSMSGKQGQQIAVGRVTGIPGIYFSSPIFIDQKIVGVVVIKINLDKLSPLLGSADSFVTDEYGVVIMSKRPELYMRALPDNKLNNLSSEIRDFRYRLHNFVLLDISPWKIQINSTLFRFENSQDPYLITTRKETDEGMVVHVISRLESINDIIRSMFLLKISIFIAGAMVIMFIIGVFLYFRSSRYHVRELQEKQIDLEAAKKRSEAATEAKAQFLANMSHEIRTPMNGVLGLIHLIKDTNLNKQQKDYLNKIEMSASALLGIIDDILDISKIDGGKLKIQTDRFSINTILDYVCNILSSRVIGKNIELLFQVDPDVPSEIIGDQLRIRQVLLNLAGNAVKFTEKGNIIISIGVSKKIDKHIEITFSVQDTGIGLSDEQQKKLFYDFSQADDSITRRFGGTGLGLSISKQLVELMGGQIGVKSQLGYGSTFFFTIPVISEANVTEKLIPCLHLKNLRILIVDDNPTACMIATAILIEYSMQVEPISSGISALEKIESADMAGQPYDLIIIDWKMPGIDGLEIATLIKDNHKLTKRPLIIMVTAYGDDDLICQAGSAGISAILRKPYSPSHIFDCINSLFSSTDKPNDIQSNLINFDQKIDYSSLNGVHILVVEDNQINRHITVELLKKVNVITDVAENGQEAVDYIINNNKKYDAILMDVQMPIMDGLTATNIIRKYYNSQILPIIAMTAHAMDHEKNRCLNAGMNDHIVKPIDQEIFYKTLIKLIGSNNISLDNTNDMTNNLSFNILNQENYIDNLLLNDLHPFDIKKALERVCGDYECLINLIIGFGDSFCNANTEMKTFINEKKFEEAYLLAHTIKGAAGSIDATSLFIASRDLEHALRPIDLKALCISFETALIEAITAATILRDKIRHTDYTTPS